VTKNWREKFSGISNFEVFEKTMGGLQVSQVKTITEVKPGTDKNNRPYRICKFNDGTQASTWDEKLFDKCCEGDEVEFSVKQNNQYYNVTAMRTIRKGRPGNAGGGGNLSSQLGQAWGNSVTNAVSIVNNALGAVGGEQYDEIVKQVSDVATKLFSKSCEQMAVFLSDPMSFLEADEVGGPPPEDDAVPPAPEDDDVPF